jgi:hypothetical protein
MHAPRVIDIAAGSKHWAFRPIANAEGACGEGRQPD